METASLDCAQCSNILVNIINGDIRKSQFFEKFPSEFNLIKEIPTVTLHSFSTCNME